MHQPGVRFIREGEGRSIWFLGHLFTVKVDGRETEGRYTLLDHVVAPLPLIGAPPHVHHAEDEAWFVLEGRLVFTVDGSTIEAGPGGYVFVPRGHVHSFYNPGPAPARTLLILSPAGLEGFFEEMGEPARTASLPPGAPPPPNLEKMATMGRKYNLELLPPDQ